QFGINIISRLIKSGFYPKGGGEIEFTVVPSGLKKPFFQKTDSIRALIRLGSLPTHIGVREKKIFVQEGIEDVRIIEEKTFSEGNAVTAWGGFRGAYVLGKKGKRAENVAEDCIELLKTRMDCDVDERLADQILIYFALLGKGEYTTPKITNHLRTNAEIIQKFIDVEIQLKENRVVVG
ncbi:hypothetical protein JXB01_03270, partial [Candidatus Micrarchaeota archaeon]|nr:hypothetical protein [Candidatus Micrarchaeota archaeon]